MICCRIRRSCGWLIQRDYETYKETATLVQGVVDRGIPVYFSHGQYDRRELL